ncbi:MAG TPA: anti-sigma regulatory factor [Spirochaetia bacterium]|nr:anti-sigma regulatory factor [Spirochaetia bacterium]
MSLDRHSRSLKISIESDSDLLAARQEARAIAFELGFTLTAVVGIVTALSEMTRNMLLYAGRGELLIESVRDGDRNGILITARDDGPGIPDLQKAMMDGYSTSGGLGMGLPGIKRLMDSFEIRTGPEKGTTVIVRKWLEAH